MKLTNLMVGTLALVAAAGVAQAQITNSDHDFSSYAWSGGEICRPCHTPHFANPEAGALWNHALTNATYTLFDGSAGTIADFDRVSRLCMSCHDGTVALDSFGGQRGTLNSVQIDGVDNNNLFFGQSLGRTGSGRAPYQFSQDAVQEFQVNTNTFSAELGRAAGGIVNVITKSGYKRWGGRLLAWPLFATA